MSKFRVAVLLFFNFGSIFSQSPDAELIFQQTDIIVTNGKLTRTHLFEIRVNNRSGDKYAEISVPYSKMIRVSKVEADLKDNNGAIIRKLVRADITDRSAFSAGSFYQDIYIKEFTLRHNLYPYYIRYSFQEEENEFFIIENWIPVLDTEVPTRDAILNLDLPADYDFAFSSRFVNDPVKEIKGSRVKYSWKTSFEGISDNEKFSPSLRRLVPSVSLVPSKFNYEIQGSQTKWSSFGDWQNDLIRNLNDLPSYEIAAVLDLIKGIDNEKEKVRILYHYLQDQTRYINVTIETGGLKPYPASYVAQNKFGDCKALSFYMKALLETAGIKSNYTLVRAGEPAEATDKALPSQQFNHVILCVPVSGDTVWLDCTSKLAFNYLGTFTQNRDVLLIDEGNSHFTRTPSLSSDAVTEIRKAVFKYGSQGKSTVSLTNSYRGDKYETLFYLQHSLSEPRRSQYIRKTFAGNGFDVSSFTISEIHRDSTVISLSYNAGVQGFYNVYGKEILVKILPFDIADIEQPGKRKLPVQLDYPVSYRDTIEYEMPPDYAVSGINQNKTISGKYGSYKVDFAISEGKLLVNKQFLLLPGYVPLTEYGDFFNFVSGVRNSENNLKVLLEHK